MFRSTSIAQHKNCPTPRALDAGESARFTSIFLATSFLCSQAESTPAPAPVTQTVGRLLAISKHQQQYNEIEKFKQRDSKIVFRSYLNHLGIGSLTKGAEIAYREVIKERGEQVCIFKQDGELT